jgi:hypothetical protein
MARPIVAGMGCAACDDIRDHDVYGRRWWERVGISNRRVF